MTVCGSVPVKLEPGAIHNAGKCDRGKATHRRSVLANATGSGRKYPNHVIAANSCLCECPGMYLLPKPQSASQYEVTPRSIAMLCFENAQGIDVTGPLSVFATAADLLDPAPSRAHTQLVVAPNASPLSISCGLTILPDAPFETVNLAEIDTLIVAGGYGVREALANRALIDWLKGAVCQVRRTASVCTGAYLLAKAGVLDGKRATTHWRHCQAFADAYPKIDVEPDAIHVRDGNIYSSAGVTAGMDLALALVEADYDRTLALEAARNMVIFLKRPGGQSQFSAALAAQDEEEGPLGKLQLWILDNLDADLSVPTLADRVAMSPRNFARVFARRTGTTPAKFVEAARLESSRRRLEDTNAPVDGIAQDCGFGNAERLRKAFQRRFRITPQDYRRRFRVSAAD